MPITPLSLAQAALNAGFAKSPRDKLVTVQAINAQSGTMYASTPNVLGWRSPPDVSYAGVGAGQTPVVTCHWRLRASDLSSRPLMKWRIVDGTDVWLINTVDTECLNTRYVCNCVLIAGSVNPPPPGPPPPALPTGTYPPGST